MAINGFQVSLAPQKIDTGKAARTGEYGLEGAGLGAVGGLILSRNPLGALIGAIVGALAGVGIGLKSNEPEKIQNRPLTIRNTAMDEDETVYISAEQWKGIKEAMARGVQFDSLPSPLDEQFNQPSPPEPVN